MLDIKFVRDNPDAVRENNKKKFQDAKLPLVSASMRSSMRCWSLTRKTAPQ